MTEAMLLETEAAVLANFEFLAQADVEMSDDDDMADDLDLVPNDDESDVKTTKRRIKTLAINDGNINYWVDLVPFLFLNNYQFSFKNKDDVDAEADEVLNELNLLTEGENANLENRNQDSNEWGNVSKLFKYFIIYFI